MQFKHVPAAVSAVFDDPNLVSAAGLVPMLRLAQRAGLAELAQDRLSVPTDKGSNAGAKVSALIAGMLAGADSIDDMNLLRHGGMGRLFDRTYAPSTLGSFLREFTFGHVRQLDAVASRVLGNLTADTPLLQVRDGERVMVDLDDTIIEVHGYQKQGAGFGYSGVRGLNALLATASTSASAPVILGQRLRQGKTGSPKGAARIVGDALATLRRTGVATASRPLLRADSAFYGHATIGTAIKAGADVSVTVRMDPAVKAAIATIPDDAWTMIEYTDSIRDQTTGQLISKAEVAEIGFTAFRSRRKAERIEGRLVVRRIPRPEPEAGRAADAVRHLPAPRVLHHHQQRSDGHRRSRQDPPRSRDHRASPRRPQSRAARAPALRGVHREQRLARPRRDRVQPHPNRWGHRRPHRTARESHDRDDPPHHRQRPGAAGAHRAPDHAAPARGLLA